MWITKKRFEEMDARIKTLEREISHLSNKLRALASIHNELECEVVASSDYHNLTGYRRFKYSHYLERCNTEKIKGVTFEELAKLYVDGTPIDREETINVSYGKR